MDVDLRPIADAIAKLAEDELHAIVMVADEAARMAAGLVSWMEHLADCEVNRRAGLDFDLQQPLLAAIPPHERVDTVIAATMIRDGFAARRGTVPDHVIDFLDAIVDTVVRTFSDGPMSGSTLR